MCLRDLLKSTSTYELSDRLTVRPYERSKVSLLNGKALTAAVELVPLVGREARPYLLNPELTMLRTDADLEHSASPKPYIDDAFNDTAVYLDLVQTLYSLGLLVFSQVRACTVGIFTVAKKQDQLRLIFDCRPTNRLCRKPPQSHLATPGALSEINLSDASFQASRSGAPTAAMDTQLSVLDLVDSFYLFRWLGMARYFALPFTVAASDVNVTEALDGSGKIETIQMVEDCHEHHGSFSPTLY